MGGEIAISGLHDEQVKIQSKTPAGGSERRAAVRSETRLFELMGVDCRQVDQVEERSELRCYTGLCLQSSKWGESEKPSAN